MGCWGFIALLILYRVWTRKYGSSMNFLVCKFLYYKELRVCIWQTVWRLMGQPLSVLTHLSYVGLLIALCLFFFFFFSLSPFPLSHFSSCPVFVSPFYLCLILSWTHLGLFFFFVCHPLSFQSTTPKAFAARKISLTSKYLCTCLFIN